MSGSVLYILQIEKQSGLNCKALNGEGNVKIRISNAKYFKHKILVVIKKENDLNQIKENK